MKKFLFLLFFIPISIFASTNDPISLNSPQGEKRLISSLSAGYANQFLEEVRYFTYQENIYFCSIASTVIVLNTLGITAPEDKNFGNYRLFTQSNVFTPSLIQKTGITKQSILGEGLTLKKEETLLNAFNQVDAKTYYANKLTEKETSDLIKKSLKSTDHLVITNILRTSMKQVGSGHFSPIAAYDPESDSVLFMDVASYKYGPVWVSMKMLYQAMNTQYEKKYRGFIIVSKNLN